MTLSSFPAIINFNRHFVVHDYKITIPRSHVVKSRWFNQYTLNNSNCFWHQNFSDSDWRPQRWFILSNCSIIFVHRSYLLQLLTAVILLVSMYQNGGIGRYLGCLCVCLGVRFKSSCSVLCPQKQKKPLARGEMCQPCLVIVIWYGWHIIEIQLFIYHWRLNSWYIYIVIRIIDYITVCVCCISDHFSEYIFLTLSFF